LEISPPVSIVLSFTNKPLTVEYMLSPVNRICRWARRLKFMSVSSDSSTDNVDNVIKCPDCNNTDLVTDESRGELICNNCGLVIEARRIDTGADWRAYNQQEHNSRARTETMSYSLTSKDLSTYIGYDHLDSQGNPLNSNSRSKFRRLQRWQSRIKSQESKDRNLAKANRELDRLSSQLDLPRSVKETAGDLYIKSLKTGKIRGFSIDSMVAACVYAAARIRRVPRTLDEISLAGRHPTKKIGHSFRILVNRMNLKIPLAKPQDYLVRMGTELGLSGVTMRRAAEILEKFQANRLTIGKDPSGIAAASLYLAGIILGEKRTQQDYARVAHVTEVTIRHRHKEMTKIIF